MRLLLIAAVMAAIGMLTTSGIIALASADEFEADASTAVAMSDAELDAYISDLIDQQFAEILEERLEGSFGATH
ncbi:MAG: hypothetical protein AAF658_02825, partial [Myxococcota bacterium]